MLSLSYGINEAVLSYNKYGDDNFYKHKIIYLKNKGNCLEKQLFSLYLTITKATYETYRIIFPYYNKTQIMQNLKLLKHFGPGNFNLLVGIMLLCI
jgi:hypothetical protein